MKALKISLLVFLLGYLTSNCFAGIMPAGSPGDTGVSGHCPSITITILSNLPDTCISNTGSLAVLATGGQSPYAYNWSSGATTSTVRGLASNTYRVTATDNNGCTASTSAKVGTASESIIPACSYTDPICSSNNGTILMHPSGGKAPYRYIWSNGKTTATLTGLAAGNYTVTVTSANGCSVIRAITLTVFQNPVTLITSGTPDTCGLGKGKATVTVTSTGSTAPFRYTWSTSGGISSTITGLTSNTYRVTVTDNNGCYASASAKVGSVNNNCAKDLPSPVANYHFDACSGTSVLDSTGKFNGTVADPVWGAGYINQGLEFNGTSQSEVTVPTILSVAQIANGFTCSAWIKAASGNSNRLIISAYGAGTPDVFWLYIATDGTLQYTFNTGLATTSFNTGYVVPVNAWTHIAMVYNQVNVILYANGVPVYSIPVKFHEPIPFGFRIGGSSSTDTYFSGTIDEVKLFTQILDSSQIQILARAIQNSKACPDGLSDGSKEQLFAGIENDVVQETASFSCYPNPFSIEINFNLRMLNEERVQLIIYDLSGKLVANLSNEVLTAGTHQISWNGKTKDGTAVPSGAYIVHAIIGDKVLNRRIVYQHIAK